MLRYVNCFKRIYIHTYIHTYPTNRPDFADSGAFFAHFLHSTIFVLAYSFALI